jgi:hypothetical protein
MAQVDTQNDLKKNLDNSMITTEQDKTIEHLKTPHSRIDTITEETKEEVSKVRIEAQSILFCGICQMPQPLRARHCFSCQ